MVPCRHVRSTAERKGVSSGIVTGWLWGARDKDGGCEGLSKRAHVVLCKDDKTQGIECSFIREAIGFERGVHSITDCDVGTQRWEVKLEVQGNCVGPTLSGRP